MGVPFSSGIKWLFDQHQRFVRSGLKVYLRVKNFPESGVALEVGLQSQVSAGGGYTDYVIVPPPNVQDVSMHNLGMAAEAGIRLNYGSKIFTISDSFVQDQIQLIHQKSGTLLQDPFAVFRDRDGNGNTLGIVYQGRMHEIAGITTRQVSGQTVSWKVVGNAMEQFLADSPETIST